MELNKELIEKALALTGKTMEDMDVMIGWDFDYGNSYYFSYPKFFYYLSSPEFLYKYNRHINYNIDDAIWGKEVGEVCTEYQSGNPKPLEELLSKI